MSEQLEFEEDDERDLPAHKRRGWAEAMYDHADMLRKAAKEEALLNSQNKEPSDE